MKAKKLIEVALPIKEISAESVRDKTIHHGHISTLHPWWARRPLPVCRAIVFASLVPDPLDDNCPQSFKDAVQCLLNPKDDNITRYLYKPYNDIPYTAILDPMEDNGRNRLMMFIGKFSETCQKNMLSGKSTSPKEQLSDGSLIKWENKNNPRILRIARELIWVAYNSMAFYQLLMGKDSNLDAEGKKELAHGVFASTGGNPSARQLEGLIRTAKDATFHLGFDMDEAGQKFAEQFKALADREGVSRDRIVQEEPSEEYKDFNDELLDHKISAGIDFDSDGDVEVNESEEKQYHRHR